MDQKCPCRQYRLIVLSFSKLGKIKMCKNTHEVQLPFRPNFMGKFLHIFIFPTSRNLTLLVYINDMGIFDPFWQLRVHFFFLKNLTGVGFTLKQTTCAFSHLHPRIFTEHIIIVEILLRLQTNRVRARFMLILLVVTYCLSAIFHQFTYLGANSLSLFSEKCFTC